MPKPALPPVPKQCALPLAGRAALRTAAHALLPRRFHTPARTGATGPAKQADRLRPAVPLQRRDASGNRQRPRSSGRRDRFLQRPSHLEPEASASPSCPLRCRLRRSVPGSHTMASSTAREVLSHGSNSQQGLSRQVHRRLTAILCRRSTPVPRATPTFRAATAISELAPTAVPPPRGGLLQAAFRRVRAGAPIPRCLYASGGHLQSPAGLLRRRKGLVPLPR